MDKISGISFKVVFLIIAVIVVGILIYRSTKKEVQPSAPVTELKQEAETVQEPENKKEV